ncbi:MAG: sulfotransferase [Pseudomonadota bacterium]
MGRVDSLNPFVIVGTQRTGSSALAEKISFHPQIACGWEWTETVPVWRKVATMTAALNGDFVGLPEAERKHIESSLDSSTQWLGFRRLFGASDKWLFHPQYSIKLWWDRFTAHRKWFAAHPHVRLIHIVRSNNIGWLKSKYLSRSSGSYVGAKYPEELRVTIPVGEALSRLRAKDYVDRCLADLAKTNPYLPIVYEDFADDSDRELRRCFEFFECSVQAYQARQGQLNKQASREDEEYIANYEELSSALKSAGLLTAAI